MPSSQETDDRQARSRAIGTVVDADLYAVDALADEALGREFLIATIPELRSGAWRLLSHRVTEVRKQRRKRIVFGLMSYHDGAGQRARTVEIVAKVYRSDRGAKAFGTLWQLWEAGFQPPAKGRVPRPYGYSPQHGTLVQANAPGAAWADSLQGDERSLSAASARAADWLLQLQRSPLRAEAPGWEDAAASAVHVARALLATFPDRAARLEPLAARLIELLRVADLPLVPSHGDYHPKNVLLTPAFATVIDFDTFGHREPAFDVGYGIGQLLIMSYFRTGDFAPGAGAALAFWQRYQLGGRAAWPRVAAQVARTLLQSLHYELCTLRNGRLELLGLWPDLMEKWLDGPGPETLEDLIRRR